MKRTAPLSRKTPLRPGKPLQRGGPIQTRTRLERGKRVNPINRKRRAKLRAQQFAEQAALCERLPCVFCGHPEPSTPHHVVRRGMGGVKGKDCDTVPACEECHDAIHQHGDSARPVEHGALSTLIHNVLSLLAERPELLPAVVPENGEENP